MPQLPVTPENTHVIVPQPSVTPERTHVTVPQPPVSQMPVQYPVTMEKKLGMDAYNPESVMLSDPGYPVSVERKVGVGLDGYPNENSGLVTLQPLNLLRAAMMCESGTLEPESESRPQNLEPARM